MCKLKRHSKSTGTTPLSTELWKCSEIVTFGNICLKKNCVNNIFSFILKSYMLQKVANQKMKDIWSSIWTDIS
jgi:hypothetical protein